MRYDNKGNRVVEENELDPRYMVRLFLIREERPKYWNFYCMYCGTKLCEVSGTMVYMTDISNEGISTGAFSGQRIRCNSRQCGGRAWFQFES